MNLQLPTSVIFIVKHNTEPYPTRDSRIIWCADQLPLQPLSQARNTAELPLITSNRIWRERRSGVGPPEQYSQSKIEDQKHMATSYKRLLTEYKMNCSNLKWRQLVESSHVTGFLFRFPRLAEIICFHPLARGLYTFFFRFLWIMRKPVFSIMFALGLEMK